MPHLRKLDVQQLNEIRKKPEQLYIISSFHVMWKYILFWVEH